MDVEEKVDDWDSVAYIESRKKAKADAEVNPTVEEVVIEEGVESDVS